MAFHHQTPLISTSTEYQLSKSQETFQIEPIQARGTTVIEKHSSDQPDTSTPTRRSSRVRRKRRVPTTTAPNNRLLDQNINLARRIRAHKQSAMTIKRHAHGPEAGVRTFRVVRIGENIRVGGVTRRRGDGLAVDEIDERYLVADGLAPVPGFF